MKKEVEFIAETARIRLRKFTFNDAVFIVDLLNSKGWLQFIGDRNVKTEEQAKQYLEKGPIKSYTEHGFGLWMVELKGTGAPIGMCGILKRDKLEYPDLGFALLPQYHGKGYAFESAQAVLQHAHHELNLKQVYAIVLPSNAASVGLLEKLEFRFVNRFSFTDDKEELCLYESLVKS